jgi:hypothetical protein
MHTVSRDSCPENPRRRQARANKREERKERSTDRDGTSPQEPLEQLDIPPGPSNVSTLGTDKAERKHDDGRQHVRIPREGHGGSVDGGQGRLDHDGVAGRRERTEDTEHDPETKKGEKKGKGEKAVVSEVHLASRQSNCKESKIREQAHLLTLAAPPPRMTPIRKPIVTIPQLPRASRPGSILYAR